ncbi:MAG: hypothetical protein ABW321_12390 [Polyangiales bacterium]
MRETLAESAEALEANDAERFFGTLDERSRHAMAATVRARRAARALIEADYPSPEKQAALAALGEAGEVEGAPQLFARRCGPSCLSSFAEVVGAPVSEVATGDEVEVTTVRGRTLHMHAGQNGRYGIVWNTQPLHEERSRASRELGLIRDNAEVYRRRSALARRESPQP